MLQTFDDEFVFNDDEKRERERKKNEIIMNFDEEIGGKIKIIEKKLKYILYILGGEKIDKVNPKSVEDYIYYIY